MTMNVTESETIRVRYGNGHGQNNTSGGYRCSTDLRTGRQQIQKDYETIEKQVHYPEDPQVFVVMDNLSGFGVRTLCWS